MEHGLDFLGGDCLGSDKSRLGCLAYAGREMSKRFAIYRHNGMILLSDTDDIATALHIMSEKWSELEGQWCIEILYRPTGDIVAHIGSHGDWK